MNKSEMKNLMKAPFSEIIKAIKDKDVGKELKDLDNLQSVCEDLNCLVEKVSIISFSSISARLLAKFIISEAIKCSFSSF